MMENARAWIETLIVAVLFGGGNLLSGAYRRSRSGVRPVITATDMIGWPIYLCATHLLALMR